MEPNEPLANSENGEFSMSRFLMGFGLGVTIGAGFALAYAPESGEQTRERISEAGATVRNKAADTYTDIADKTQDVLESTRTAVGEWIDRSKEAVEELRARLDEAVVAGRDAYAARKQELDVREESLIDG